MYGLSAVTKKVATAEKFFARTKHQESHSSVFLCNPTKQCRNLTKSVRREAKTDNSYRWFTEALRKFLRATLPSPCCANLHIIIVRGRAYKKSVFFFLTQLSGKSSFSSQDDDLLKRLCCLF